MPIGANMIWPSLKHTIKIINIYAIQYVGSIRPHKRRIKNNQSIPT